MLCRFSMIFLGYIWIDYIFLSTLLQNNTDLSCLQNLITCAILITNNNYDCFDIIPEISSPLLDVELTSMQFCFLFGLCLLWFKYCTRHKLLIMISKYYRRIAQIQWLFDSICLIMNHIKQQQHHMLASMIIIIDHQCYERTKIELRFGISIQSIVHKSQEPADKSGYNCTTQSCSQTERKCISQTQITSTSNLLIQY